MRFSAHLGTLFPELSALARPAAARAAGFAMVEAWWPPAQIVQEWVDAVRAAELRAVLVNADGGDLPAGERGFCNVPGREEEVLAATHAAARVVRDCGGEVVNLLVGRIADDRPERSQRDLAAEVVRAAAEVAAAQGARIVVEHLNPLDVERPLLPTPAAAAAFVVKVDHPGVRLLYDAYHAARAGLDPLAEVARVADVIGHAQYSDCPGRGAPGTGTIDLWAFLERLDAVGYTGPVGLEFIPDGPTPAALSWVRATAARREGATSEGR